MLRLSPWLVLLSLGCSELTMPTSDQGKVRSLTPEPTPALEKVAEPAQPAPRKARRIEKDAERVSASHVLVAYKGAARAKSATRTKEEAKKLADEVRAKVVKGGDFAALAKEYSDDSGSGAKGGDLGSFDRSRMTKPFADAAFALKVGDVSQVVESEFGFHVIKRTK